MAVEFLGAVVIAGIAVALRADGVVVLVVCRAVRVGYLGNFAKRSRISSSVPIVR